MNVDKISQNVFMSSGRFDKEKEYWSQKLQGDISFSSFPYDNKWDREEEYKSDVYYIKFPQNVSQRIMSIGGKSMLAVYIILLSGVEYLLGRFTGNEDILVGMPVIKKQKDEEYINTGLILRSSINEKESFKNLLVQLKEVVGEAVQHQNIPFNLILDMAGLSPDSKNLPGVNTVVMLENLHDIKDIRGLNADTAFIFNIDENDISVRIEFNKNRFESSTIERLSGYLLRFFDEALKNPDIMLLDTEIMTQQERNMILSDFNNTKTEYPRDMSIQEVFMHQVKSISDSIAVVYNQVSLTYSQLNNKADALAAFLRHKGVKKGSIVALMCNKSIEMIIGILAVLKAGGAYMPIDPAYPMDRVKYMLDDSGSEIMLTYNIDWRMNEQDLNPILASIEVIDLGEEDNFVAHTSESQYVGEAEDMAYVIYTSGSTGKPKGAVIKHRNVIRLVKNANYVSFDSGDRIIQTGAMVFDASTFEIWGALLNGLSMYIVDEDVILDPPKLGEAILNYKITTMWLTSPLFNQLSLQKPEIFKSLKYLLVGGDVLSPKHINSVRKICKDIKIINGYGPTENTTFSTCFTIDREYEENIPIGKPISNSTAYIIDRYNRLQPVGALGELCVGGDGVALGYINNPGLTMEKFVDNPFSMDQKMYKTGDMARWLPDGNIEFLGRKDQQVKIRGFRIELGEIESCLLKFEGIKECIVVAREDKDGAKCLCAYYVLESDQHLENIREYLREKLPGYMVPSYLIKLDQMPLNINGKIDRKRLPDPLENVETGALYEAPKNEIEEKLVLVWQELLGLQKVGVHDNFFELGGDSIKAIQISARLQKYNLKMEVKDLFQYATIRELGTHVKEGIIQIAQGTVEGEVSPTPIQKWFFEGLHEDMGHFNQAVMLYRKDGFDETAVRKAFTALVTHHDALRMVCSINEDGIKLYNRGLSEELYSLRVIDFSNTENYAKHIELDADNIQSSIDLIRGPLVKLGLFKTPDGDHLLIAIHHLVVDGVSFRIILEDFAFAYTNALEGKNIELPQKTHSFLEWSEKLRGYASHRKLIKELSYWSEIGRTKVLPLVKDNPACENRFKDNKTKSFVLTKEETGNLLSRTHRAYNTEINEILLCALGLSVKEWSGNDIIALNLEGHGREEIIEGMDITRTVGWFTSSYPVILDIKRHDDLSFAVRSVKEALRRIPNRGIGYGVLKYITPEELKSSVELSMIPEISFNYLGQFDADINNEVFGVSGIPSGNPVGAGIDRRFVLDISGMVAGGVLSITVGYNSNEYKEETISAFLQCFHKKLLTIIEHCIKLQRAIPSPSDMENNSLSLDQFDKLLENVSVGMEKILPLTPMQSGMLFHSLMDRGSTAYFEQMSFDIEGVLNTGLFTESCKILSKRYEVLRTVFLYENVDKPLQIVLDEGKIDVILHYISLNSDEEKVELIEKYKQNDKKRGFDLSKDALMRMTVIKTGEQKHHIIWSFHHIIMDGWCISIVIRDFFLIYNHLSSQSPVNLGAIPSYSTFIKWLEQQDEAEAVSYWKKYLEDYEAIPTLPCINNSNPLKLYRQEQKVFTINERLTKGLQEVAKSHQVTLNTVFQVIWGVMLQKYSNSEDVVFGSVVSGRPPEVRGIESMVGLFINTVPVRVKTQKDQTFSNLIKEVHQGSVSSKKYEYVSLAEVQSAYGQNQELFDNILVFENYPVESEIEGLNSSGNLDFRISNVEIFDQTNYNFNVIVGPGESIILRLSYNAYIYDSGFINRMEGHFKELIQRVVDNPDVQISEVEMLTSEEKNRLIEELNDTVCGYPQDNTIHQLFEDQVERTPDKIAVVYMDRYLSYRELNQKANILAVELCKKQVTRGSIVAVLASRSLEMVVGMIAVLKAGGAYLPISPDYPDERIKFMLEDSGSKILLTHGHWVDRYEDLEDVGIVDLENQDLYKGEGLNIKNTNTPDDLAYIIYTSGTTGKPKGAMIEHKNVVRLMINDKMQFAFNQNDVWTMFHSFAFDFSVWEMYGALLYGGRLIVVPSETARDTGEFLKLLKEEGVTVLNQTPTAFYNLINEELKCENSELQIRYIIFGGEALKPAMLREWRSKYPGTKLINMYGITETTVHVTYKEITEKEIEEDFSNIGKPIPTLTTYIMNKDLKLMPEGTVGELCVGGLGVGRGYLGRPELTEIKFVDNPYKPGEKLYRSGDLAKLLPSGDMEYIGRGDQQVKIRGFRIELGEIESKLLKHDDIKEVVVIPREDKTGNKYLCAYIISQREIPVQELREYLAVSMAEYMIPSYFIRLDKMPVNHNGKIDRKALPEPSGRINTGIAYEAPRNAAEEKLALVWQEVLNLERVGIRENFFELGGDSIKAIQVAARLHRYGLKMEVKDLFQYPTIGELGSQVKKALEIFQGIIEGEAFLTPIQKWFFERQNTDIHHFNQSLMLYKKEGFEEHAVRMALQAMVEHHDALRMMYSFEESVSQYNRGTEGELFHIKVVDLRETHEPKKMIEHEANAIQGAMNLKGGILVNSALFKTNDGDHLLIAIHHLVVDGVSWRILLEDFENAYLQALEGSEIILPKKTHSFMEWSKHLTEYARGSQIIREIKYWNSIESIAKEPLPRDNSILSDTLKDGDTVSFELTQEETVSLLNSTNRAYNTEINDILLTALGIAVKEWAGIDTVVINLEGHGREEIFDDIDITRTVGWFTSIYPVALDMTASDHLSQTIRGVKEYLRRVPNRGIGYGILKYLTPADVKDSMVFGPEPYIGFNYLGQFDNANNNSTFSMSKLTGGAQASPEIRRNHSIDINAIVVDGKLAVMTNYNRHEFRLENVTKFANIFKESLINVINHCISIENPVLTPYDTGNKSLSLKEFDCIMDLYEGQVEKILTLTPMQSGMLFHSLLDKESNAYFEQLSLDVKGFIDIGHVEKSFNLLIERYEIFRAAFVYEAIANPCQVILLKRSASIHYYDVSNLSHEEKASYIEDFKIKDREKVFDLQKDMLIRLSIIKLGDKSYSMVWSHHHILMDGWCMSIIIKEFFTAYAMLLNNNSVTLPQVKPYSNYIKWLEGQDEGQALTYWEEYLKGYENQASVPYNPIAKKTGMYKNEHMTFELDQALVLKIDALARSSRVTLNTVFQAVWGIMLGRYNNIDDVVFGAVVSGRPSEVSGVESLVGLFINTVPVRVKWDGSSSFSDIVKSLYQASAAAKNHEYVSLAQIQAKTGMKQSLVDNILVFENFPVEDEIKGQDKEDGLNFTVDNVEMFEQTNYDFNILVIPGKNISIKFSYNSLVYDASFVKSMEGHLKNLLEKVSACPDIRLGEIDILDSEERKHILYEFNDTKAPYPDNKMVYDYLEYQADNNPERIAAVFDNCSLSYGELNKRANQLARVLRSKGVKRDSVVGIMTERSPEMIIGIFAILKAGGAYLPISPDYPEDRISFMLSDSEAVLLLTQRRYREITGGVEVLDLEDGNLYMGDGHNLERISGPHDLAYVIYTSGSTGKPKGAMIEHHSAVNRIDWMQKKYPINEDDVILQKTPYTFDVSVWELFWWSFTGSKVVFLEPGGEKDPEIIIRAIEKNSVTVMHFVPSMLNAFLKYIEGREKDERLKSLKQVFSSGEALNLQQVESFNSLLYEKWGTMLINLYGPTEATVDVSYFDCSTDEKLSVVPIGKPIHNIRLYILDKNDNLQPVGAVGELCISGVGVGRGYLNRPELTMEKFLPDPFFENERMYRTGDLARWLPDGNIEYLQRLDHQVKIRGFRIELGEIENRLMSHPEVGEAVVIPKKDNSGSSFLVGFYTGDEEQNTEDLKEYLSKYLADYMIPSYIIWIDKIPLSPNGKADRKALAEYKINLHKDTVYEEPQNAMEQKLADIWSEILEVERIGANDNFFELGGHSLKTINLVFRVYQEFGVELPLKAVFETPTIRGLALHIKNSKEFDSDKAIMLLNKGEGRNIFAFPPMGSYGLAYAQFASLMEGYSLYTFNFIESSNRIEDYAELILEQQKEGPFILLGYSAGGNLAFEVAKELSRRGFEVSDLIMVDSGMRAQTILMSEEEIKARAGDAVKVLLEFMEKSDQFKEVSNSPYVKERISKKIESYMKYFNSLTTEGKIDARLHLIEGEQEEYSEEAENARRWEAHTRSVLLRYKGYGRHEEMLNAGFVERNVEIIKSVLGDTL